MGDALMGLGMLLAILGPLLLIPVVWLLYRFALKPVLGSTWKALPLSIALVAAAILLTYIPGKRDFDDRCAAYGPPVVSEKVRVDGFFRTKLFMYEAVQYLSDGGFEFVEAPDPYTQGVTLRYTMGPDRTARQDEVEELLSLYGVRETFTMEGGVSVTQKTVYDLATGRELARAAFLNYQGGPLSIFLGALGMASCPDIRTAEGSKQFQTFYDLEKIVLRSEPLP
jgi:hypothetical protein